MNRQEMLPVITLYQPWASWVMLGWKTIETRTHPMLRSLDGKPIGIYASAKIDEQAMETAKKYLDAKKLQRTYDFAMWCGYLLGTARVVGFKQLDGRDSQAALCDCDYIGMWGLLLAQPVPFDKPIKVRGHQGIWYINKKELCQ